MAGCDSHQIGFKLSFYCCCGRVHAGQVHEGGTSTAGSVRHHKLVLLDGNEFFLTRNADFGAGLFLKDVNIGDVLGPDGADAPVGEDCAVPFSLS